MVPIELWSHPTLIIAIGTLSILESRMGSQREQTFINALLLPSPLFVNVGKKVCLNVTLQHFRHTERPQCVQL